MAPNLRDLAGNMKQGGYQQKQKTISGSFQPGNVQRGMMKDPARQPGSAQIPGNRMGTPNQPPPGMNAPAAGGNQAAYMGQGNPMRPQRMSPQGPPMAQVPGGYAGPPQAPQSAPNMEAWRRQRMMQRGQMMPPQPAAPPGMEYYQQNAQNYMPQNPNQGVVYNSRMVGYNPNLGMMPDPNGWTGNQGGGYGY